MMDRHTGILLHVSSLPGGPFGTFGDAALRLIDQLADAGCDRWQMLPLCPPDGGGSPYSSPGALALSRLFLDLPSLVALGLLDASHPSVIASQTHADRADVDAALRVVDAALDDAWRAFGAGAGGDALRREVAEAADTPWLHEFAQFTARMRSEGHDGWWRWPAATASREPEALAAWDAAHAQAIARVVFEQALLARQWARVRAHAQARGVGLIGDIPIFVAGGSADVWAHPHLFDLDADGLPRHVAGVPPDYFSETGQRWGNPLYDWDAMAAEDFAWWSTRFALAFERFDEVRVDHFRGFEAFWQIPRDHETAIHGRWVKAPGRALFDRLIAVHGARFGDTGDDRPLPILVEDLGIITPEVEALRDAYAFPGCRVLQFGLGDDPTNPHLPSNVNAASVVYTGTHDNHTARGWYYSMDGHGQWQSRERFGHEGEHDVADALLRTALATPARWVIAPAQDILALDGTHRMNMPGTTEGNWSWRLSPEQADALADALRPLDRRSR
jgi:4-alpha-glucanotransferase